METSVIQTNLPKVEDDDDDDWENDGFVIPSLEIEQENVNNNNDSEAQTSKPSSSSSPKIRAEENNIYLGPHGAPPSQLHDGNNNNTITSRKQRFKQKLKEADEKMSVSGRENKLANLRELVGGGLDKGTNYMAKSGVSRDWLDPHCHESQFEKRRHL